MATEHNMQEIILANLVGISMLICVLSKRAWQIYRERESKYIHYLVNSVLLACILEPVSFYLDGSEYLFFRIINYAAVSILFILNISMGAIWFLLVCRHIYNRDYKFLFKIVNGIEIFSIILTIINFFKPILFGIDENGYYFRGSLYTAYVVLVFAYIIAASIIFFIARIRGGQFKWFPAVQLAIPVGLGTFIQYHNYGISTMYPSIALGITLLAFIIQSENIYTDKMLGIKNRYYLDRMGDKTLRKNKFYIMFVDINNFKHINDNFGHAVGDRVLKQVADILRAAVGNRGTVIRYAGDEFILLINTTDEEIARTMKEIICNKADEYNKNAGASYELALAVGYYMANTKNESLDDAIAKADKAMYRDKQRYYEIHERRSIK